MKGFQHAGFFSEIELPMLGIVGDWIVRLCRALRRAVAFSPYLLSEGWIKRGSKHD